ncbi:MAG TPA: hypothetical protein VF516_07135 [Kofleriaceae bacterium]
MYPELGSNLVHVIADVTSHTYSVLTEGFVRIARQYQFRTQQLGVTHLQQLSAIVDGPEGSVAVCGLSDWASSDLVYSREDVVYKAIVPLANNEALLDDGETVSRVDAGGRTVAQIPSGGKIAADAAGNVFVADVADTTLTIDKYDPGLAPRWRTTQAVPAGTAVQAIASDAYGAVVIALTAPEDPNQAVLRFTADGAFASQASVQRGAVALDGDQPVVAWSESDQVRVARFSATGEVVWSRSFAGRAAVEVIAVDPFHNVVFGGELATEVDFGGGPLPLLEDDLHALHTFVVKLSASGDHVFSKANGLWRQLTAIASNGARVVVTGRSPGGAAPEPRLQAFDAAGNQIFLGGSVAKFEQGFGGVDALAIGASGRIWWNLHFRDMSPSFFAELPYLLVLHE